MRPEEFPASLVLGGDGMCRWYSLPGDDVCTPTESFNVTAGV